MDDAWGVLEIRDAGGQSSEQRLSGDAVTIGRSRDNVVALDDHHVSRHHARIEWSADGGCLITDLGSANGTRVGGEELEPRARHPLGDGESAVIGPFTLTLSLSTEAVAAAPDSATAAGATIVGAPQGETVIAPTVSQLVISTPEGTSEVRLEGDLMTLGRSSECDIVIEDTVVSRHHADIKQRDGYWEIRDAGSLNGLTLDGEKVASHVLRDGDTLSISETVRLTFRESSLIEAADEDGPLVRTLPLGDQAQLSIGRDASNDVRLDHPAVSRHHAHIARKGNRYTIEDLGSANGTFVNGERLQPNTPCTCQRGDSVRIGPARFTLDIEGIQQVDESRDLRLDSVHLNQPVSRTLNLLQDISLSFQPREFIAVVGVSGAGKSTLLDALNGFRPARGGQVLVNGVDLYENFDAYRTDLGYVPQDDIIHKELPIARALSYSAQLRLPPDTSKEERSKRVEEVMETLGLSERREVPISRLSGGQRKRVSIGAELLTKPGLFFLDEATSGLDPGTESQMMRLLRSLADRGHTVVLVTHATKNVMLCDQVVFLAKGGYLAWFGPPDEALDYFEVEDFDGIYERLEGESSPEAWGEQYRNSPHYERYVGERLRRHYPSFSDTATSDAAAVEEAPATAAAQAQPAPRQTSQLRQLRILSARYMDIVRRDRVNVALLLAIAPILGMIDLIAWPRNIFEPVAGDAIRAMTMLFMAALIPFLVGALSSVREIVKETPIYKRERAVTLKVLPYLLSKVWVGFLFAFYHAAALFAVKMLAVDFSHVGSTELVQFYFTLTLAAMSGVMWGLLISVVVPREEQAMVLVIAVIVLQIVFSGGLLPLGQLGAGGDILGGVTSTKWSFQALTTASHVREGDCEGPMLDNCLLPGLQEHQTDTERAVALDPINERFGDVFGADVYVTWAAMGIIILALFVIIVVLQRRKDVI